MILKLKTLISKGTRINANEKFMKIDLREKANELSSDERIMVGNGRLIGLQIPKECLINRNR